MRNSDRWPAIGLGLAVAAWSAGCAEKPAAPTTPAPASAGLPEGRPAPEPPTTAEPTKVGAPAKRASGLVYETRKEGTGPQAKTGDKVTVHCVASVEDEKPFFSTRETGHPVTFKLGNSQLIQGWNEGITGMKVGELRKLTLPPSLAYGALGRLPVIPPNGTLKVEVEALAIGDPPADLKAEDLGRRFTLPSTSDLYGGKNEWVEAAAKEPPKPEVKSKPSQ